MHPSPGFQVLPTVVTIIVLWLIVVVAYALMKARSPQYDPLPAELPEHHDDHGGGHGHDAHAHDAHGHDDHGHGGHH